MNNAIYIDLFLITIFFSFVGASYYSIKNQKEPLLKLLAQGLIIELFNSIKYLFLLVVFVVVSLICIICWRIHEILIFADATGISEFLLLGFIFVSTSYLLLYDLLGKFILIASRRLGL